MEFDDDRALRVMFVCQWYRPEPVTQPVWIAEGLRDAGADVTVLTGIPNYPDGAVAQGYRAWRSSRESIDGLRVRRTPLYPSHSDKALGRILNYVSWAASSAILGLREVARSDVALVYSSPATAAIVALAARRLFGTPYVLLIQDLWPDSVFASGFLPGRAGRVARALLTRLTSHCYRHAAKVLVISPGMADLLAARGVETEKLALVYNWVPDADERPVRATSALALRERLGIPEDAFVLMYAGNLGKAQALDLVIEGMAHLGDGRETHLVLVGSGVEQERLESQAARTATQRIHFVGSVDRFTVVDLAREADAQLVSLAADPLFEVTMPSKVQSILASGMPVLCCVDGDAASIIQESGAGVACPAGSPDAFARSLERLRQLPPAELDAMGRRGRRYYEDNMAQSVGVTRLMNELASAADRPRSSGRE